MEVPFLDLIACHAEIEEELTNAFQSALRSGKFVGGCEVEQFEREFAAYSEVEFCIAVNSGTDALRFALLSAGVGKGDLVLTVANTFIATTEAIAQTGAEFDFIDIDERTYGMDVNRLRSYLERGVRVKAVAPVHLYGQMVDMDPILQLAENYNFLVIEDACQAHGARYYSKRRNRWLRAGSMGDAAAFSFYPGKNLGACGEGGAITTNNPEVARRAAMLRDHGQASKYYHDIEGYNGRLDAIQCSFLRIKLRTLDEANEKRRNAASVYAELLTGVSEIALPYEPDWAKSVYHLYVVRTSERDALQKHLQKRNIGTGLHYPLPLHLQKCYAGRNWSDDLSATNAASSTILSLPMYPGIQREQQKYVADCIREFFQESHPDMRRPIGIEMIR